MNNVLEINVVAKPKALFPSDVLKPYVTHNKCMVGSRFICSPPPQDTDEDWLCYVQNEKKEACLAALEAAGWKQDGGEAYKLGEFVSLRQEGNEVNLIITDDADFFVKFKAAAKICKMFNVMDKQKRIEVHNMVLGV